MVEARMRKREIGSAIKNVFFATLPLSLLSLIHLFSLSFTLLIDLHVKNECVVYILFLKCSRVIKG